MFPFLLLFLCSVRAEITEQQADWARSPNPGRQQPRGQGHRFRSSERRWEDEWLTLDSCRKTVTVVLNVGFKIRLKAVGCLYQLLLWNITGKHSRCSGKESFNHTLSVFFQDVKKRIYLKSLLVQGSASDHFVLHSIWHSAPVNPFPFYIYVR